MWVDSIDDLKSPQFEDNTDFFILVDLLIGDKNLSTSDSFHIQVGTAKGLEEFFKGEGPVFLRHFLLVEEYNWNLIEKTIIKKFKKCYDDDWNKMVKNLVVYFGWEYENHRYLQV